MVEPTTIATRSYPKRKRGLSRVLERIAACRNNNRNRRKSSTKKKKKKKQTSAAERKAPSTKSLSLSSSQQESSCCSSSHNGSATTWDESSFSKASSTTSSPCTSPEDYSQPVITMVSANGFPAPPALAQPLLLGATESEVDAETLLFTAKETSSVMTDASCQDDCQSKESSSEDEMLGMEVKVSTTQGDDHEESQDGEDCLLVSPHDEALVGRTAQVAPSSPNIIYCPEDTSSRASSNSSTGSNSSQLYPLSYYSSGDEASASSILVESVDQAKVTKFTKFLQKARAQQQQDAAAAPQEETAASAPPAGSIKDFYSRQVQAPARLPEVNVVMPDIIKLPPTESITLSAASDDDDDEDVEDKVISFLVLFCIVFLLWLAQETLAAATAPLLVS